MSSSSRREFMYLMEECERIVRFSGHSHRRKLFFKDLENGLGPPVVLALKVSS